MRLRSVVLGVLTACVVATPALPVVPAAAVVYGQIEGSGPSGPWDAVDTWFAGVAAEGLRGVYIGSGSAQSARSFEQRSIDFALLEPQDAVTGRPHVRLPITASPLAFPYRINGADGAPVENLRLSSPTLAAIMTGAITTWADPAVTADNNGRVLPSVPITRVVRSDGSGATEALTAWLAAEQPGIWAGYHDGGGSTPYFPQHGAGLVARPGAAGVTTTVSGTNGAIGYAESSDLTSTPTRHLSLAKIRNAAGLYAEPTGIGASITLRDESSGAHDPRAYPVATTTSLVLPTAADDPAMTTAKRQSLVTLTSHALCSGQATATGLGHAPLPRGLVQKGLDALAALAAVDPAVELPPVDASACAVDLDAAARPAACDRSFSGPCGSPPPAGAWPTIERPVPGERTLRARPGAWTGPAPHDVQWLLEGDPIVGATSSSFTIPTELLGHALSVRVVSRGQDPVPEDTSPAVIITGILPAPQPDLPGALALDRPRVVGKPLLGRRLRAVLTVPEGATTRLAWYAGDRRLRGQGKNALRLTRRMVGSRIRVEVVAMRPGYLTATKTSRPTAKVRRTSRRG